MSYRVLDLSTLEGRRKLVAQELGARMIRMNQFDNEPGQAKEHVAGPEGLSYLIVGAEI